MTRLVVKGSASSGWYGPPRGTHTGERHREIGSGRSKVSVAVAEKPKTKPAAEKPATFEDAGQDYARLLVESWSLGQGIRVSDGSSWSDADPALKQQVIDWVSRHPQNIVDSDAVRSLVWTANLPAFTKEYDRVFSDGNAANTAGLYSGFTRTIVLRGTYSAKSNQLVFDHEMGHGAWKIATAASRRAWTDRYNSDAKFDRRTDYARRAGPQEAFCETYMAWVGSGGHTSNTWLAPAFDMLEDIVANARTEF